MKSDSGKQIVSENGQQKPSAEKTMRTVKNICKCGMMAAVIAILSSVTVPLPVGVPITLQTFAAALCGYLLGSRDGVKAVGVYLLLGAVGLPVYSGMCGGISVLTGITGGYLYGFLPMAALCGLGRSVTTDKSSSYRQNMPLFRILPHCHRNIPFFHTIRTLLRKIFHTIGRFLWKMKPYLYGYIGLLLCHTAGILQLAFLTGRNFAEAMTVGSVPYLLKDIISVTIARNVSLTIHVRAVRGQRGGK